MTQLKVIISGGFSTSYRQLLPEFENSTGISVTTLSGASQGKGPETIAAQLGRGVAVDVAILSREGLTELIAAGRIVAGSDVDLATAALGAAVRSGAPRPDIGTVAALKQALLSARVVAVPASTSGIYLTDVLFPRLGIADQLNIRVTPRGSQSAALVAAGEADIAVQPTSELVREQGLSYLGPIPAELQLIQTFSAAIIAGSKELEASKRLIAFLASGRAAGAIRDNGMQPMRKRASSKVLQQTERVIITEWRFAPGAETGWHRHQYDYVVVCLTAGKLLAETAKGNVETELQLGQSYARPAGVEHNIVNANEHEFAFVEIELK
jgi:molybdate transport system substrate-binding protein